MSEHVDVDTSGLLQREITLDQAGDQLLFASPLAAQRELDSALEGVHVAEHELGQARAALGLLQAGPGERTFVLRAPVAGQVLKVHQASETTVALGAPVLDLGDLRGLEVLAELGLHATQIAALQSAKVV